MLDRWRARKGLDGVGGACFVAREMDTCMRVLGQRPQIHRNFLRRSCRVSYDSTSEQFHYGDNPFWRWGRAYHVELTQEADRLTVSAKRLPASTP